MQYSFVKQLIDGVWMIHPSAASAWLPVFQGALSGLEFIPEQEPANSIPYMISASAEDRADNKDASDNQKQIYVTSLRGVVLKHDAMCGPVGTRTIAQRLLAADRQENIIGHILVTESGGGLGAAVPELADAIASLDKPIVAWVDGMTASAAYYINSYCNHIMASRASDQVGCIGTLINLEGYPKFSKLQDGKIIARIYADGSDEKNEEYEAALEGNFKLIKERVLNPHNDKFKNDIKSNREKVLPEHLRGRTYNASEVIGSLVDSIGSFEDAIQKVIELSQYALDHDTDKKPNNSNTMPELTNLNAIESIRDFALVDNQASFNMDQLKDMEQKLSEGATAAQRVTELEGQATKQTEEINALSITIQQRDTRITELETALQAATSNGAAGETASIIKPTDGNHASEVRDEFQEAKTFCENHLKNHK